MFYFTVKEELKEYSPFYKFMAVKLVCEQETINVERYSRAWGFFSGSRHNSHSPFMPFMHDFNGY
jgi:hypothetical protein